MEKAIPFSPTSSVDAQPVQAANTPRVEVDMLREQMTTARRLAAGIADSMLRIAEGDFEIADVKRWNLFFGDARQR